MPEPPEPSNHDLTTTITEALTCTTCRLPPPIPQTILNPTNNSPFHPPEPDDPISPRTIPDPTPQHGYYTLMSTAQRGLYETALGRLEAGATATATATATRAAAEDVALQIQAQAQARYMLDLHIHVHMLVRRGVWTFCRSGEEVEEMRRWRWRVGVVDELMGKEEDCGGGWEGRRGQEGGQGSGPQRKGVGGGLGRGRSRTSVLEMYQMALWRRGWRARRQRVDEARKKWAVIVEERRRQREAREPRDGTDGRDTTMTKVRLYCSHEGCKSLIREVEVEHGKGHGHGHGHG